MGLEDTTKPDHNQDQEENKQEHDQNGSQINPNANNAPGTGF